MNLPSNLFLLISSSSLGIKKLKYILQSLIVSVGCVAQWAERRSLAGELTLSCARPAADG